MTIAYKKVVLFVAMTLAVVASLIIWLRYNEDNSYKRRGKELINKIEAFRNEHNRLPNAITELQLEEPMNDGPYYEKKDSINYIVFFNIGFDESKTYFSETKQWKDEP